MGSVFEAQALYDWLLKKNPESFKERNIHRTSNPSTSDVKGRFWDYVKNCGSGECMLAAICQYFKKDLKTDTFYQDQMDVGPKNGKSKVRNLDSIVYRKLYIRKPCLT
jgi:hypothetical protein